MNSRHLPSFGKETAEQWKPPGDAWTDLLLIVSSTMRSPTAVFMEEESLKLEGKASVQLCKSNSDLSCINEYSNEYHMYKV